MALFAMLTESFAVVGDNSEHRRIVQTVGLKRREELTQRRVDVSDLAIIGRSRIFRFERLGRFIRIVRVIEMHPQENRHMRLLLQPSQRVTHYGRCPPLLACVAAFTLPAGMETGVIDIKSTSETGSRRALRIEHLRSHKRRSRISVSVQ